MSALRSVRYENASDITWVGGQDGEAEEEMDLDESEDEEDEDEDGDEDEMSAAKENIDDNDDHDEEEHDHHQKRRYRQGKANGGGRIDKEERGRVARAQALPIAELPDDYDGQVLDGATYLAISARVNATLPNYTRMSVPPVDDRIPSPTRIVQPQASSSRHPALPNEVWSTVFPLHFKNYRSRIKAEWSPELPYPSHLPDRPRPNNRGDVWQYIRGCRRKLVDKTSGSRDKGKGKAVAMNGRGAAGDGGEDVNGVGPDQEGQPGNQAGRAGEQEMDSDYDDEEEAMNTAPPPKVLEAETEKHQPHEPLVSALQEYTSVELVCIIELITTFISETLDLLSPFVMIPNDADTPNNPFPEIYMRWLFACLLLLDDQLDGQSMSSIRDLARTVMKVAAWRWIRAVTDKEISADEGADWKYGDTPTSAALGEVGLEATLGRCWIIFHAVVAGWAQRDLLDDLESMFK